MSESKSIKMKSGMPEIEESLLVKAFAEIMPEVKFIDVTPKTDCGTVRGVKRKLENETGKKISTSKNYLRIKKLR